MVMKSVKNAMDLPKNNSNFFQIDHIIKQISGTEGVLILPSPKAWEKFSWTHKLFNSKPKEGYFIWVKKQVDFPLYTCIAIASPKIKQNLKNLMVVEEGLKVKANVTCAAARNHLYGSHVAKGKLILKTGACLEYNHIHSWGEKDFVNPDYEFILGENSHLKYIYKNLLPPENLNFKTSLFLKENASVKLNIIVNGVNSQIKIEDSIYLEGKNSDATASLRLVGKKNSRIDAVSKIIARNEVRGHLDCQGILVDDKSKISLAPQINCENKKAQITHEASIGRINEEQLTYLMMRGLTEKQAIELIISGFLKVQN
jgi:uncharacterized protein